jgi:hypothetical protein
MSELIQQNWHYFVVMYAALFGYIIYKVMFSNRGKIKVRIKTPSKERIKWCKPEADGETIVIDKAKTKKAGWSFKFTNKSLVPFTSWGRQFYAIDIFHHAPDAIEYDYSQNVINQPKWDKDQSTKFINAKLLEKAGAEIKEKSNVGIWIVAILVIVGIVITLISGGKISIG